MPKTQAKNSRTADKFVVRMLDGQRDRLAAAAESESRAMNDVAICALDAYLDGQVRQKALLDALERELNHQKALTAELQAMRAEMLEARA